ncbi:hypothetical protein [Rhodococcoides yunnanense]|uniref:hypothetical protein n=1 Tax=Rhodococcoides yunnanense TaxID=278209 RepID=UPI001FE8A9D9|nr:hypothetical protein [Rhodococcus yunnanensis]
MRQSMQKLLPADELLHHQTVQTFATVSESDISWTEKVWSPIFALDGSLQIDCGLGKYHNRNVMDMFAGVSRGTEQITVRASRTLDDDLERIGAGPFDYEVIEPMKKLRLVLRKNDIQPIEFDVTITAILPPFLEAKDAQRDTLGLRMCSEVLRYHQACTAEGTLKIDGSTVDITPDKWLAYRDHSWGVRMDVGEPPSDVHRLQRLDRDFTLFWTPMYFKRPDGSKYEIHFYLQKEGDTVTYFSGFVNESDGSQHPLVGVRDDLKFDPKNRRLLGGTIEFDAGWGETRRVEIEPISDTGFHLGTGLYFGFRNQRHGIYAGPDHLDGERIADVSTPDGVREVHQLRDLPIRTREGDAEGYGIFESMVIGEHPKYGLTREDSFL